MRRWLLAIALVVAGCGGQPARPPDAIAGEALTRLEDGVTVREVTWRRGGVPMTIWVYRGPAPPGPRPVVVIGAAGSPLVAGMALSPGDRPEHLPWVERGYVVVAYSIDGAVVDGARESQVNDAIRAFARAHAGLDNARAALDFALTHETGLDAKRVFAVGHSSAATLAMRFGAEDPRVTAVVSFCGVSDVVERVGRANVEAVERLDAWIGRAIRDSSPIAHVAGLRGKALFLFWSTDDDTEPPESLDRFLGALGALDPRSRLERGPFGGHYDAMIETGLGMALDWAGAVPL
jgi:dienelactone hydrolase